MKTVFIIFALATFSAVVLSDDSVAPSETDKEIPLPIPEEASEDSTLYLPAGLCRYVGQFLPDTRQCDVFYHCDAALIPRRFHCAPGGLCWNQRKLTCQWNYQPGCSCRYRADDSP